MYYIMSTNGHRIVDITEERPTKDTLEQLAQETCLDLYVIEGERAGIEYNRPEHSALPERKPVVSTATLSWL